MTTPNLFGDMAVIEPANVMDLCNVTPFAVELARELSKADTIRRDPFKHLPARLMPPTWACIVSATSRNLAKSQRFA